MSSTETTATTWHERVEFRPGSYHDSVTLLRVAQAAASTAGVSAAQVAMATELNVELTRGLGFTVPEDVTPQQLIVAIRAVDDAALTAALEAVDGALAAASAPAPGARADLDPPRTVRSAARSEPDSTIALLSVPGPQVLAEGLDAIAAGKHLMIFSDNVPVADEVLLKQRAAEAGVLVMGPDCGTAIISGVGLGFANVLGGTLVGGSVLGGSTSSGTEAAPTVGIVAASGTGAQHLSCLLDAAGVRVSHVLGLGGRDLSEAVGGASALTALQLLEDDPGTDHIVLVSKPPHPATAQKVLAAATALRTPVSTVLLGTGNPDITSAVEVLLATLGVPTPNWAEWGTDREIATDTGDLRGLFAGGTLADEAMIVAATALGGIRSNIPLRPEDALPAEALQPGRPVLTGQGHVVVDLGDDAFTLGRPHPMIDPSVRLGLIADQAADPQVRVILLDVVLGHCAEPDPAAGLVPAIRAAVSRDGVLDVVVSLCGTSSDPQDLRRQAQALVAAGARVHTSNSAAARDAATIARGGVR
ncbi:MAG: hypothetical protein WKF57_17325 [Nakamurella sp.]